MTEDRLHLVRALGNIETAISEITSTECRDLPAARIRHHAGILAVTAREIKADLYTNRNGAHLGHVGYAARRRSLWYHVTPLLWVLVLFAAIGLAENWMQAR